jgi:hypothetical protein
MALGSRLTMWLSSLGPVHLFMRSLLLGKIPARSGVVLIEHRTEFNDYAYRETPQSMRACLDRGVPAARAWSLLP